MNQRGVQFFVLGVLGGMLFLTEGCGEKNASLPDEAKVRFRGETWTVELAMTEQQRYDGLSGRKDLPAGRGMLFVYPKEQKLSFCMRGCEFPIDILFLDRQLRVINLYEMAVEPDRSGRTAYESHVPVMYALELPGGAIRRTGIRVGDTAEFFGVPPAGRAQSGN